MDDPIWGLTQVDNYRACIPQKWCRVLKATKNNTSTPSISEMNPSDELKHRTFLPYNHKLFKLQYFLFFYCFVYFVWRLF